MPQRTLAPRLARLPVAVVRGAPVPIAIDRRARLLGLAHLERCEAGAGLFIPHCRSVHTFGMRFALDIWFLDRCGDAIEVHRDLVPRRLITCRGAAGVLELPSGSAPASR